MENMKFQDMFVSGIFNIFCPLIVYTCNVTLDTLSQNVTIKKSHCWKGTGIDKNKNTKEGWHQFLRG